MYRIYHNVRGGPIATAAISGIEIALWDIKGKALGVPVYELLGGRCRDRLKAYGNGWTDGAHRRRRPWPRTPPRPSSRGTGP